MPPDLDQAFKALADPTRRRVLDRLHSRNGQTLTELCDGLSMARQSASQHIAVLEAAGLVSADFQGRTKVHYLNPVPLHEIQDRWIHKFERPRLLALDAIKQSAEEHPMNDRPTYVYVTYIRATAEAVWQALTSADLTAQYWGHSNVSDWQPGSTWEHRRIDGSGVVDVDGTVIESRPPTHLTVSWGSADEQLPGGASRVSFLVEPHEDIVRLTVRHENLTGAEQRDAISGGWPAVIANLKSLLETGAVLPQSPWEVGASV